MAIEIEELSAHNEGNETWRRLLVTFPETFPTHCRQQTFYFGADGLLRRLDYSTDVLRGVVSHYVYDHTNFSGIKVPTLRRAVGRGLEGPRLSDPTAVLIQISDVSLS